MKTVEFRLKDEFIKLGQILKAVNVAESGVDAKYLIQDGKVLVNGEKELQRGKKIHPGDEVVCGDVKIQVLAGNSPADI
ncbi:MAG: RNA-binding S4 domain-containing protein [Lachnospiraceae bacterium]|nr:RNA-binding S4 domain-containing protein [Lachnospiraceae bacterium]